MAPKGSDTLRRRGFVEVGVALLEEMCHVEMGFEVSYMLKPYPVSQFTSCCFLIKMESRGIVKAAGEER